MTICIWASFLEHTALIWSN